MEYPAKVMVVGNGGRECALATALLESEKLERLYITPANWGVVDSVGSGRVTVLSAKPDDTAGIVSLAAQHGVQLVVIGPEAPLVAGLADRLRTAGIPTVGPGAQAARLEGSKLFAKQFMDSCSIPTGACRAFTSIDQCQDYIAAIDGPCVVKADGLAAGKGVIVCGSRSEAEQAAQRIMVKREFGEAGDTCIVEERLSGPEISFTCLVGGGRAELLGASTDYKPLLDGNEGPNTGGMGNICPTPHATSEVVAEFNERILAPLMHGLAEQRLDYRGFLFVGTMLTGAGLKVLEFNVRLGDPEAQVVLPMNAADWPEVLGGVAAGYLSLTGVRRRDGACVAVVLASAGYPVDKAQPQEIRGLGRVKERGLLAGNPPPVRIYFAGVGREVDEAANMDMPYRNYYDALDGVRYLATGGRVLAISAYGESLSDTRRLAYEVAGNVTFEGAQLRSDIGKVG